MFSLKIENANGEIFELTHDSENYNIIGVQGLTPPPIVINASTGGNVDGTFYNSSRLNQRNIVITIVLNGDIESNRQRLYQIFNLKKPCTIYFKNANRDVKIQGYVETLEADLFTQREQVQVSIICPRPYFEDLNTIYTELSQIIRMFEFPFEIEQPIPFSEIEENPLCTIINAGDAESGFVMRLSFTATITELKIYNTTTQKFIGFDYTFLDQDELTINTMSGQMGVTLIRDSQEINLLNFIAANSTWLKLALGENKFTYTTSDFTENVNITFITTNLYGGV